MDLAEENSCDHYPICYVLIMKYIYMNLIFASNLFFCLILLHLQAVYDMIFKWPNPSCVFFTPVACNLQRLSNICQ